MAYGTTKVDVIQSSTANVPVQFNDGNGTQVGTLCRAWLYSATPSSATTSGSFNISSFTRSSAGNFTVNFTTAMADVNYAVTLGFQNSAWGQAVIYAQTVSKTTSAVAIQCGTSSANQDPTSLSVAIFR